MVEAAGVVLKQGGDSKGLALPMFPQNHQIHSKGPVNTRIAHADQTATQMPGLDDAPLELAVDVRSQLVLVWRQSSPTGAEE